MEARNRVVKSLKRRWWVWIRSVGDEWYFVGMNEELYHYLISGKCVWILLECYGMLLTCFLEFITSRSTMSYDATRSIFWNEIDIYTNLGIIFHWRMRTWRLSNRGVRSKHLPTFISFLALKNGVKFEANFDDVMIFHPKNSTCPRFTRWMSLKWGWGKLFKITNFYP